MFAAFPWLCDTAGLQLRAYHSRSGTDGVLLLIPNASGEELVLQLVSSISFTLRKMSVQLMISSALWVFFSFSCGEILLSEMHGDSAAIQAVK